MAIAKAAFYGIGALGMTDFIIQMITDGRFKLIHRILDIFF